MQYTTHSDYSLPDYEAFYIKDDHIKEKSNGSTTSHSGLSLLEYESFHFDLSIDLLPPAIVTVVVGIRSFLILFEVTAAQLMLLGINLLLLSKVNAVRHNLQLLVNVNAVEGKGFSGRETPLFLTMVVQNQADMGEGSAIPIDPHHTPTIIQPSTSQPQRKQRPRKPKRKDTEIPQSSGPTTNVADEAVNEEMTVWKGLPLLLLA
ncbi:hypothetical protein Tco_1219442 [Tanacetum coccineum]